MPTHFLVPGIIAIALLLTGCGTDRVEAEAEPAQPVLTREVRLIDGEALQLSGTVRARTETALAFQVGGRIARRDVDAGQTVQAGQVLLSLDPSDLDQARARALATADAAAAALRLAEAESRRGQALLERQFISAQAFEQLELVEEAARQQHRASLAVLAEADHALAYAQLRAPFDGLLISVGGEPGQVVAAGHPVAMLARTDRLEVEVLLPEALGAPESGLLLAAQGQPLRLSLREVAGAADPQTRAWPARYRLDDADAALRLGSVVRVSLSGAGGGSVLAVPISAIHERGQGPVVWRIVDGQARPLAVELLALNEEYAHIQAELVPGERIIAAGLHRLQPGQRVRDSRY